ncbi:MAG: AMP-binding protein [Siphonobacter sp.]
MIIPRIVHTASKFPEKEALVHAGKRYSYEQLVTEIARRAADYQRSIRSKNVILARSNPLENLLDLLAMMAIGKSSLFASQQVLTEQLKELQKLHHAFLLDDTFRSTLHELEGITWQASTLSDRFLGVLSSGTESTPKVIWKDYQSWVSAFPYQSDVFGINSEDRLFILDALGYSANLNSALHMLWQGGTVVMTNLKSAGLWGKQMEDEAITSVFMVPSHYRLWVKVGVTLPQLRSLVCAGEKLDLPTARILREIFPNALLTEYYGVAELGHISYQQNDDILEFGYAVGKAFPGVKIQLIDQRIRVESPYISPDYRGINTVFDLGIMDEGRLILVGRAGQMFNRRGLNVFAEEIENSARQLDFILEVAVVGKLREDGSHDRYPAFTSRQTGNYSRQLKEHLLQSLPAAKQPRRIIECRNLPRKDHGKLDYQATVHLFGEEEPDFS